MRIGIFLHEVKPSYKLDETILEIGNEIVGYSSPAALPIPHKKLLHFPSPLELAVCCDLLVFYSNHSYFNDVPEFALRRGANIFFANSQDYSHRFLMDIHPIASEIGAIVGFGNSGYNLFTERNVSINLHEVFFAHIKRSLSTECSFVNLKEKIIYDLSSVSRTFPVTIKKYKSITLPVFNENFNLLNLSIEFNNGSVVCYTADRLSNHPDFSTSLFANSSVLTCNPNENPSPNHNTFSPLDFISCVKNGISYEFDIYQAIQTLKLFEEATKHALQQV